MQNTDSTTQVFTPPEGGHTPEQQAEYKAAFQLTEAEYASIKTQQK